MNKNTQLNKLSDEASKLYRRMSKEWAITDSGSLLTLLTACQALDRMRQAQKIIETDGVVAHDRFGQPKPHPACQVEKESRAGLLQALKALSLDLESLEGEEDA